ncbi:MAG: LPS export ABC transporter ATP-binding protein [Fimbriimonadaceae bacterium]|nr:LPS export ABC transporter ATP-binding protein [Fimbriimonadaceae bacterium]
MKILAEGLVKAYKGRNVVDGVTFEVNQGEVVGLLGPNGAGKTTTFYMIIGLIKPNSGHVRFDDLTVTNMPMFRRARAGVGYLPQETSVFRRLTVRDNIRLVMEINGASRKAIQKKTDELAEELHIQHILDRTSGVLSGGERRRVEIARSLSTDPKFILLDEPFTGIDPVTIEEIQGLIYKLKLRNIGVLITDHNVAATLKITDRNNILIDGKIFASGTADEITQNEMVRKHYLGEQFDRGVDDTGFLGGA